MDKIENTTILPHASRETHPSRSGAGEVFYETGSNYGLTKEFAARERSPKRHTPGLRTPLLIYSVLALTVLLPMLLPGYILTLDMAFTPLLRMPETMSSSYLFHTALHYLNVIIPSQIIQKLMLFTILLLSGVGMHLLVRHIQSSKDTHAEFTKWGAYIAGLLYMINPFTYSRFMAGQYAVLLGYALLPFFVRAILQFFAVPTLGRALTASGWLTVIGIVSLHTLGSAAILTAASLAVCAWRCRQNCQITWTVVAYGLVGVAAFVLASGYWLFPLLDGTSLQGQAAAQFGAGDQAAFVTTGGDALGKLGNILQLQGFWAEGQGLYLLPQDQLPGWGIVVIALWVLIGMGVVWLWRHYRSMALLFVGASTIAIILAITGMPKGQLLFAGLREPQKLVGIVAMTFALFAGLGATAVLAWTHKKRSEYAFHAAVCLVAIIPVLLTPTMFWGFSGQLSPRHYPADWYAINDQLNRDQSDFRVLSLPWHLYMHYPFAGRVIANPSEAFFDKPTIASNELEFNNASPTFPDTTKKLLTEQILPNAANDPNLGKKLGDLDVKYILLAKTYDYKDYTYLDDRTDLKLLTETENLKLYRNEAYGR